MFPLRQLIKQSQYGLVIDWKFHRQNRWVCAQSPYLVDAIIKEFNPVVISSQLMYEFHKRKLKYIISFEPGWAAPKITYDTSQGHTIGVFASDPHNKTSWFQQYVYNNNIRYVFSMYYYPFIYHFPHFDLNRLLHVPWAIPDDFVVDRESINCVGQNKLHIFGAALGEAYETRNWCRQFSFVENHDHSGVENKILSDAEYFQWGRQFDAVIAAGSSATKYQLVTPKYFEIPAAGSLLFAQECRDLELLGFDDNNCIIFDKTNFEEKAMEYLRNPTRYIKMRRRGCQLIKEKHKISDRVRKIRELMSSESL